MATINHNNGPVTATGNYCPVTVYPYPLPAVVGQTSSRLFRALGWMIVGNGSAAGSVALQVIDPLTGTYSNATLAPFPLTLSASLVSIGKVSLSFQGARFVVTLSAGQLSVCELIAEDEYES